MPSRKQVIYCRLLYEGLLYLRAVCSGGGWGTDEQVLAMREEFRIGQEEANFLHRVHGSILEPEYESNDLSFINWAFPVHIKRLGGRLEPGIAALMLEFYEAVPESLRPQLEWHPSKEFRALAQQRQAEPGVAADPAS